MANHRLFVALRPPAATRVALLATMGGVPGARWQDDSQLHCTLRFIGEVDRHQAEDIVAALGAVRHPALTLRLGGAGMFDRKGRIETLWIGVRPRETIEPLHQRIDRALHQVGIAPDDRAFVPHITIARFPRAEAPLPEVASRVAVPIGHRFEIGHFELFESQLGSDGAVYETVARYLLGGR
jgi:2'-5' RNA ligase